MSSTLAEVVRAVERRLSAAGVPSPRVDAELLVAHLLGTGRGELGAAVLRGMPLDGDATRALAGLEDLVLRRVAREPLQHLTGRAAFAGIELAVGLGVFVPRPETEVLVEAAVHELDGVRGDPLVVDLCTGSAAIALAVADAVPTARVVALELDERAISWAARNVAELAAGERVELRAGDVRDAAVAGGVLADLVGQVDLVTANPPYIPPDAVPVQIEVAEHDPAPALYGGGEDGLEVPRAVLATAGVLLRSGGLLLMEHADVQGPATRRAADRAGYAAAGTLLDRSGRDRVLHARRPAADSGCTTPG